MPMDFSFLEGTNEPLAFIVALAIVGYKFIELIINYFVPFISKFIFKNKIKEKPNIAVVKKLLDDDKQVRVDRQAEVDKELRDIKGKIEELFAMMADHEEFAITLSQGTLENQLLSDSKHRSNFQRLKAFLRLLALDVNGRVKQRGMELILENQDVWLDVMETIKSMNLKILNPERFNAILDEINHKIYDGMMR